jgi:hypothetical protein
MKGPPRRPRSSDERRTRASRHDNMSSAVIKIIRRDKPQGSAIASNLQFARGRLCTLQTDTSMPWQHRKSVSNVWGLERLVRTGDRRNIFEPFTVASRELDPRAQSAQQTCWTGNVACNYVGSEVVGQTEGGHGNHEFIVRKVPRRSSARCANENL